MTIRRHHYERAFESYLRAQRIPYVAVNEARKALLPPGAPLRYADPERPKSGSQTLKSFDVTIYGESVNLLVEVKGRKVSSRARAARRSEAPLFPNPGAGGAGGGVGVGVGVGRLDNWVTLEDIESLRTWERLFGPGFEAAFVFLFWCDEQPPDGLFQEIFAHDGRWYAVRAITLARYAGAMKTRSRRWGTVHLPARAFERLSHPFVTPDLLAAGGAGAGPQAPGGAAREAGAQPLPGDLLPAVDRIGA